MADQENTLFGHRDACDECHQRKVRCTAESGACGNCIIQSKTCMYSPKVPVGRPRKRKVGPTASSLKTDKKRAPQSAAVPLSSFSGFDNTNLDMASPVQSKATTLSDSPLSYPYADSTMWNMEPNLVSSLSISTSSVEDPFSVKTRAAYPQNFPIGTKEQEADTLLIDSYENNCRFMLDNQPSSALLDEGMMCFAKEKTKDMCVVSPTPLINTVYRNDALGAHQSLPQVSRDHHGSSISSKQQNRLLKGQDQIMPVQWPTPLVISLTFNSLLNTLYDVRSQRDRLLALISSHAHDGNRSPPEDMDTILQPILLLASQVEPYLTLLESRMPTLAVGGNLSRSLQCEKTTFQLLVATSTFILEILRLVSEHHEIFVSEVLENSNVTQHSILPPSRSPTTSDLASSQSSISMTSNDLSQSLNLIIYFTTIDYYVFGWQRSLVQIFNMLKNGSEKEKPPKELTDASAYADALRYDLKIVSDVLRGGRIGAREAIHGRAGSIKR